MVNETILLERYDKDIRIIVNGYLVKLQYSTKCSFYDDLISEASIAFLLACRSFQLTNYELTNLQRSVCKSKIESALRVFVWKLHGMGGYNTRPMDLSRTTTISDVLGDTGVDLDEVVPLPYEEDFTIPDVQSFFQTLTQRESKITHMLMAGHNISQIGRRLHRNVAVIYRTIKSLQNKYADHFQLAA